MRTPNLRPVVTAVILLAAVALTSPTAALQDNPYQDLLGTWDVETEDGAYTFVWEFTLLEEGVLKGLYSGRSGDAEMTDLKFENNMLEFNVDVGMEISFSASVDGDFLEGTLSLEFGDAGFTGKKRSKS